MKAWVTGAGGFMGVHLVDLLLEKGCDVLATYFRPTTDHRDLNSQARVEECDLRDREAVQRLVDDFKPGKIFHLGAQSYPTVSWTDPWHTVDVNIVGTINIFEALKGSGCDCKVLNACSSAQYGFVTEDEVPVREDHELKPLHPYGVSKAAQEMLAYQYYRNFGLQPVSIRIFNTTGPRKTNDVCADLTKRLIEIEKGVNQEGKLRVGSLTTKRAITDVRDCIRGFDLALDKGKAGEAYNLSGATVYEIQDIVDILRESVEFDFKLWQDPELIRPTDEPIIFGSTEKLTGATGWEQEIPLRQTLQDMLDHWRRVL